MAGAVWRRRAGRRYRYKETPKILREDIFRNADKRMGVGGRNSSYTRRPWRTLANDSICLFLGGVARASVFGDYVSWRRLINRKQAAVSQVPAQSFAAVEIKRIVV